jgi:HK97 family phage portal protein
MGIISRARRSLARWLLKSVEAQDVTAGGMWGGDVTQQGIGAGSLSVLRQASVSLPHRLATINAQGTSSVTLRLFIAGGTSRFPTSKLSPRLREHVEKRLAAVNKAVDLDDVQEITSHNSLALIRRPNPLCDGFTFEEGTHYYQWQIGDSFWVRQRDGFGAPIAMWQLQPWRVTVIPEKDASKGVKAYVYDKGLPTEKTFDPKDVCHFRHPNPFSAYQGRGEAQVALRTIVRAASMTRYKQALWDNDAQPGLLFGVEGEMTLAQQRRFLRQWEAQHKGTGKARRVGITSGGAKVLKTSFTPREAALIQEAKYDTEELCQLYGVPVSKLTFGSSRGGAETSADDSAWLRDTILPNTIRYELQLNAHYVPWFDPSGRMFFMHDDPVPANREMRLKEIETRTKTGYSSINQERELDGLEPVPWGESPLMPLNVAPLGTAMPEPEESPPEKAQKGDVVDPHVSTTPPERAIERRLSAAMREVFCETAAGGTPDLPAEVYERGR